MDTNLSIHHALNNWDNSVTWPYLGSILMINKNVPLFETEFGRHDYDWVLAATETRKCKEIPEALVIRHIIDGENLSMNPAYREEDYALVLAHLMENNNTEAISRLNASRAKYFYKMGKYKDARFYFKNATFDAKNIGYFLTSFYPKLARWIAKRYNVWG